MLACYWVAESGGAAVSVSYRYQPPGSHEGFVEGLLLEGRLRLRIAELQAHRAAGRRTMAEVCTQYTCANAVRHQVLATPSQSLFHGRGSHLRPTCLRR